MMQPVFFILLVALVIKAAPNFYLDSILSLSKWISFLLNFETKPVEVENEDVLDQESREIVEASKNNKYVKVLANPDEPLPIPVVDLDQLSNVKTSNDQHEMERVKVPQQLESALYDNSTGEVFEKSISHIVDLGLGLVGNSQRKRSAEKCNGLITGFFSKVGKWVCGLFPWNNITERFDVREAWPECKDITSVIRNQAYMNSCWAVTVASVVSDRLCIASRGKYKKLLSAENIMRCCKMCLVRNDSGEEYGLISRALVYLKHFGTVTGGEYDSGEGCIPYSFPPYEHPDFESSGTDVAECEEECSNEEYETPYKKDKYYLESIVQYTLPKDETVIKEYLKTKGSCVANMEVFEDFQLLDSGTSIYKHRWGDYVGHHAVRLMGYGKENRTAYWLIANSWGSDWGDEGVLKMNTKSGCSFGDIVWCVEPKTGVPIYPEYRS